jgi:hypothetical protein
MTSSEECWVPQLTIIGDGNPPCSSTYAEYVGIKYNIMSNIFLGLDSIGLLFSSYLLYKIHREFGWKIKNSKVYFTVLRLFFQFFFHGFLSVDIWGYSGAYPTLFRRFVRLCNNALVYSLFLSAVCIWLKVAELLVTNSSRKTEKGEKYSQITLYVVFAVFLIVTLSIHDLPFWIFQTMMHVFMGIITVILGVLNFMEFAYTIISKRSRMRFSLSIIERLRRLLKRYHLISQILPH